MSFCLNWASLYLSTYLFFQVVFESGNGRNLRNLPKVTWDVSRGPGARTLASPSLLSPLISIRVAGSGLRTPPDAAFPYRYLLAPKEPVTVCSGLYSHTHKTCFNKKHVLSPPSKARPQSAAWDSYDTRKAQGIQNQDDAQIPVWTTSPLTLPQLSPLYNEEEKNIHLLHSWEDERGGGMGSAVETN